MVNIIRGLCVTLAILCLPTFAAAQAAAAILSRSAPASSAEPDRTPDHGRVSPSDRKTAGPPSPRRASGAPLQRRDSLWNGVLIGAGLGALAGAVGGQAALECSECAGFNVPLTFGVIGAGVGAGIGAGIDALRHSHSAAPGTYGRVTVMPLLGRGRRAVVAAFRF